jgi:hypothetical protein
VSNCEECGYPAGAPAEWASCEKAYETGSHSPWGTGEEEHRATFLLDVTQHGTRYTSTCMGDGWVGTQQESLEAAEDEYMAHVQAK